MRQEYTHDQMIYLSTLCVSLGMYWGINDDDLIYLRPWHMRGIHDPPVKIGSYEEVVEYLKRLEKLKAFL